MLWDLRGFQITGGILSAANTLFDAWRSNVIASVRLPGKTPVWVQTGIGKDTGLASNRYLWDLRGFQITGGIFSAPSTLPAECRSYEMASVRLPGKTPAVTERGSVRCTPAGAVAVTHVPASGLRVLGLV